MRLHPTIAAVLILAVPGVCSEQAADPAKSPAELTLEEVVKMVRAGVTQELVIARIKRYNKPFDLSSDEIVELKNQGVNETILVYLVDPSKPYTPPAPPPATPATPPAETKPEPPPPKDPLSVKVPPEPGMYWVRASEPGQEAFELIELKPLVPMKSGGKLGSMLTGGLMKGQTVGSLAGPSALLHIAKGDNAFYARMGPKVAIEDVILLRAEKGDGKRFVNFGPKPAKPVFPPESIKQYASKQVSEGLYRMDVPALPAGEYVFLILGSGDEKKGVLGKGYDFAVNAPGKGK